MPSGKSRRRVMGELVADASALVDLLLGNACGHAVARRVRGNALHAPAHVDAEVLSALGRLHRAGALGPDEVGGMVRALAAAPIRRHPLSQLLIGAWSLRHQLRPTDALYVELAVARDLPVVTTDRRLGPVPVAEVIEG